MRTSKAPSFLTGCAHDTCPKVTQPTGYVLPFRFLLRWSTGFAFVSSVIVNERMIGVASPILLCSSCVNLIL